MTPDFYRRLWELDLELETLRASLCSLQARLAACRPGSAGPAWAAAARSPAEREEFLRAYA
jgi:hypothetical protein